MDYYQGKPRFLHIEKARLDRELAEFHDRYLAADDGERSRVRECVNALADNAERACEYPNALCCTGVVIRSAVNLPTLELDGQGKPINQPIEMSVRTPARAIAAWDHGDGYTPEDSPDLIGE